MSSGSSLKLRMRGADYTNGRKILTIRYRACGGGAGRAALLFPRRRARAGLRPAVPDVQVSRPKLKLL